MTVSTDRMTQVEQAFARAYGAHTEGRFVEAREGYLQTLTLAPGHVGALENLSALLLIQGEGALALALCQRAVQLSGGTPVGYNTLGAILRRLYRYDEAMAAYEKALALKPDFASAWENLGKVYRVAGPVDKALACFDKALALNPENQAVLWDRALTLLQAGNLEDGFAGYETRLLRPEFQGPFQALSKPRWAGESLVGKTVLLIAEQGLGDTLQFIRYASAVKALGAEHVVVVAQPPLLSLLARVAGVDRAVAFGDPVGAYDCYIPLLSLPFHLKTTLETIPSATEPYLTPPADWSVTLPDSPQAFKVGVVWAGSAANPTDDSRSIPFEKILTLLSVPGIALYSLQVGDHESDLTTHAAAPLFQNLAPRLRNFDDTASAVMQLDLVITVDTSVAHLAGGLGRPTWVLLSHATDWRWLQARTDSPWYPTVRLFRQPAPGDWDNVLQDVLRTLQEKVEAAANKR